MATTLTKENKEYKPLNWESVSCPFCNNNRFKEHEKYGPNHRYTYVQCLDCKLVYSNQRPIYDQTFVETAYSVYDVESYHFKNSGELNAQERAQVDQLKITLDQIHQTLGRKGKILDLGCHTGLFLKAALEEGWDCFGIDISEAMTQGVTQVFGIPTLCGQYHLLDLKDVGPFDVIYSSHVIEHIPNPNEWASKFLKDLKKDGILCLNIPNQFSWDRIFKRGFKNIGLKKDNWELWRTPDHLYEPHLKPMKYFLEKNHFKMIKAFTYSKKEKSKETWVHWLYHHYFFAGSKLRVFGKPNR